MVRPLKIEWTLLAKADLKDVLKFYKKRSLQGYSLVKNAIILNVEKAANSPIIFEPDRLKINNDGSFRAFTVYHSRITYEIRDKVLIVHRVRHTSREPLEY